MTEQQIITGCKQYQKSIQYELVKRYSGKLLTVCRRYAADESMAKDMLQETFIQVFRGIQNFKQKGSFEGWLHRIATNCSLQWLRKGYLKRELTVLDKHDKNTIEPEIYSTLHMEEILHVIQELPHGYRTVFNLNIIDGYSHKEISEMLDISEGTSRSQLARARKMMQERINSLHFENRKTL